jgi:antitoxin ParD1/3/4
MEANTIGIERTGCLLLSSSSAGGQSDSQDLVRLLLVMDIGEHFEQLIKSQIKQNRYTSASEVIRDGLQVLEVREQHRAAKLEALRPDIQQGINSGPGRPLEEVAAELHARYQH